MQGRPAENLNPLSEESVVWLAFSHTPDSFLTVEYLFHWLNHISVQQNSEESFFDILSTSLNYPSITGKRDGVGPPF